MSRKYGTPPIREALCELYFTGSRWDDTTQGMFYERIKVDYPEKQPVTEVDVAVKFEKGEHGALFREAQSRMRYLRVDGSRLVQLAPDLLVVNQLRPYPHFEEWKPVVSQMAQVYSEVAAPKAVRQLGLRYINAISISLAAPTGEVNLEEYFNVYPEIPPSMGGRHGPYMLRMEMPVKDKGHALFITFSMNPSRNPSEASFTLDLYDIFAQPFDFSIREIENQVQRAHDDQIEPFFENFITDKLRSLFGGRKQ